MNTEYHDQVSQPIYFKRGMSLAAPVLLWLLEALPAVLAGVMFYEAQIAGLPDTSPAVRWVKRRSAAELADRRGAVVDAVKQYAPLRLVNSGGTGSLEVSSADPVVTEVTAGSGFYGPTLFDKYDVFQPEHAVAYALDVVRRPAPRIATLFGGGYVASGPAKKSRLPSPAWPSSASCTPGTSTSGRCW